MSKPCLVLLSTQWPTVDYSTALSSAPLSCGWSPVTDKLNTGNEKKKKKNHEMSAKWERVGSNILMRANTRRTRVETDTINAYGSKCQRTLDNPTHPTQMCGGVLFIGNLYLQKFSSLV